MELRAKSRWRWVKRIGVLGLVGLTVTTSALAWILFAKYKSAYTETLAIRLDPLGERDAQSITFSDGRPIAMIFGDSRARQWALPEIAGWQLVANGVVGQTTKQARLRFAEALTVAPKVIVIQMGILARIRKYMTADSAGSSSKESNRSRCILGE